MSDVIIRTTLQGIDTVKSGLAAIGAEAGKIQKQFTDAAVGLKTFGDNLTKNSQEVNKLGMYISRLSVPIAAAGGAAVLAAARFEQTSMAMQSLIGNTQDATKFLNELKDFAARTPFTFVGISDAAKQMMAMGFEAKGIIPIMRAVGDATSALGTGQEGINRIIYALGQMRASATLNSQDMRQLTQAFVNGWQYIADATGKSVRQIKDETARGMTDSATAVTAIIEGMEKQFGGMMAVQAQTLLGVWSNFQDRLGYVLIDIGDEIARTLDLREIANNSIGWLHKLQNWWDGLSDSTRKWTIYAAVAAAAAGPLLIVIGQLGLGVGAAIKTVGALATVLANPLTLAVGAAIGAIAYATTVTGNWGTVYAGLVAVIQTGTKIISAAFDVIKKSLSTAFSAFMKAVHGDFTGAWKTLVDGGGDIKDSLEKAMKDISYSWTTGFDKSKKDADKFVEHVKAVLKDLNDFASTSSDRTPNIILASPEELTLYYLGLQDVGYSYKTLKEALEQLKLSMKGGEEVFKDQNAQVVAYNKHLYDLRQKYYPDVIAMQRRFSDEQRGFSKNWDNWKAQAVNAMLTWQDVATNVYGSITAGFGNAMAQMIVQGKNWHDTLKNLFKSILSNFVSIISQMVAQWAIMNALKPLGLGVNFGGGLISGAAQGAAVGATGSAAGAGAAGGAAGSGAISVPGVAGAAGTYYLYDQQSTKTKTGINILQPFYNPVDTVKNVGSKVEDKVKSFFGWASGGDITVSQPTLFMAGETGAPERVSVSPMAGSRQRGNGATFVNQGMMFMDSIGMMKLAQMLADEMALRK